QSQPRENQSQQNTRNHRVSAHRGLPPRRTNAVPHTKRQPRQRGNPNRYLNHLLPRTLVRLRDPHSKVVVPPQFPQNVRLVFHQLAQKLRNPQVLRRNLVSPLRFTYARIVALTPTHPELPLASRGARSRRPS